MGQRNFFRPGSWGLKAREDHKAQERSRKEKKEKVRRDLARCMEIERKLIRGGVQAHYGEYAGKGSKGDHKGNQEEAEATGLAQNHEETRRGHGTR